MAISSTQLPSAGSQYEILTTTQTWTPPTGYTVFDVIILGAGGGGGGGGYADLSTITYGHGGCGGASGYALFLQRLRITSSVSVTIGTGGAGGAGASASVPAFGGTSGSRGGTTAFGDYRAPGGGGGGVATSAAGGNTNPNLTNNQACYDATLGQTFVSAGGGNSIQAVGGSGGSAGGSRYNYANNRSSAGGTVGGAITSPVATGSIFGGSSMSLSRVSGSSTVIFNTVYARGSFGQQWGEVNPENDNGFQLLVDTAIRRVGDLWYVAGGGGAGLTVSSVNLYGEGGFAGTATTGGNHGDLASATLIDMTGQTATAVSAGGGGGGGSCNTGVAGGNGGAGANGAVIIYYGN